MRATACCPKVVDVRLIVWYRGEGLVNRDELKGMLPAKTQIIGQKVPNLFLIEVPGDEEAAGSDGDSEGLASSVVAEIRRELGPATEWTVALEQWGTAESAGQILNP